MGRRDDRQGLSGLESSRHGGFSILPNHKIPQILILTIHRSGYARKPTPDWPATAQPIAPPDIKRASERYHPLAPVAAHLCVSLIMPAPSLCAPEPWGSFEAMALIHALRCWFGRPWFRQIMERPEPPVGYDGLTLFGPCSPLYGGVPLLSGAPRCCYSCAMISSAGHRMATGSAPTTATGASSLRVSLPGLFFVAFIVDLLPLC